VDRHPSAHDVALVIEVAESSLARDRDWKGAIYARELVRQYWIVNLQDRRLEVYTDPTGPDPAPTYRRRQDFKQGEELSLPVGSTVIALAAILP
jgi:Uma2 family endonuclease